MTGRRAEFYNPTNLESEKSAKSTKKMLGLGLSLLGGAVMEDADGARAYFPAAAVRCNAINAPLFTVWAYSNKNTQTAEWDIEHIRGGFACRILQRGSRSARQSFGGYSNYNSELDSANYYCYSGVFLQMGGERNITSNGNRSVLHYSDPSIPWSLSTRARNWLLLFSDSSTGELRFNINGATIAGNVFGTALSATLPPMRFDAVYSRYSNVLMFAAQYMDIVFYGSYWCNSALNGAWQCLPMQSAAGEASLFETTTQQLVEHESLSTAA